MGIREKKIMIDHNLKVVAVHIPKSGGLSIRYILFNRQPDRFMHCKPNHPDYEKYWNDYFTFTFVRNPFDRLVSGYLFTLNKKNDNKEFYTDITNEKYKDFNDFIINCNHETLITILRFEPQVNWIRGYKYNFIGRFENLEEDLKTLQYQLDLEIKNLPLINNTINRKPYWEYYTEESKEIVENLYKDDLMFFNYKFDE